MNRFTRIKILNRSGFFWASAWLRKEDAAAFQELADRAKPEVDEAVGE